MQDIAKNYNWLFFLCIRPVSYTHLDYLIRAKIRETTYHFTNGQAGKPIKWGKLEE